MNFEELIGRLIEDELACGNTADQFAQLLQEIS